MSPLADIAAILDARNLASFNGLREDTWLEAKGINPYDFTTAAGRFELAKDVSAFANAEGGYVVVGLTTAQLPDEQTEAVTDIQLMPRGAFNDGAIVDVLRTHLHPRVHRLEVMWVEDRDVAGMGLGVIYVPEQPPDNRFILMNQVIVADAAVRQIVFGIAIRRGAHNAPLTIEQLHRMCQEGRSTSAERLTRIEAKIDSIVRLEGDRAHDEAHVAQMNERLKRILGNE